MNFYKQLKILFSKNSNVKFKFHQIIHQFKTDCYKKNCVSILQPTTWWHFQTFFPNVVLKGQKLNAERHFAKIFLVFVIFICLIVLTFPFLLFAHSIAFLYKLIFFLVENLQVKCNLTSFWAKKQSKYRLLVAFFCWSSLLPLFSRKTFIGFQKFKPRKEKNFMNIFQWEFFLSSRKKIMQNNFVFNTKSFW